MPLRLINSIRDVDPDDWDALPSAGYPFTRHAFLKALEDSGSVAPTVGWQPAHLLLEESGSLVAAAPLYLKSHSRGEFVFDWSWADAYRRFGLRYYPKLLNAIPFTPTTGPRLLAASGQARARLAGAIQEQAEVLGVSSAHALFLEEEDKNQLDQTGFLQRYDCQYRWDNDRYKDFAAFLAALSASKRKKIRRERQRVAQAGINMEWRSGDELSESLWHTIYRFYANTYHMRGQHPYLNRAFWLSLSESMGEQLVVIIARHNGDPVAAALAVRGSDTLYGRHWGCAEEYHSLHFEACYYQGIEYCIQQGLAHFDAGVQGPHKINRGFMPVRSCSAHWIADTALRHAIAEFLDRERNLVTQYIAERETHSPYRQIY